MSTTILGSRRDRTFRKACLAAALAQFAGAAIAFGQAGAPSVTTWSETQPGETRPTADAKGKVVVDENNLVDLAVNDEDLGTVLEMLSIQSQKNIIASKNVTARVSANLFRVSFYEALDAVLNVNGYGYVEKGNFIYIYTTDELKALADRERVRVSKVIPLNYLNSTDAAEFVRPLLSVSGAGTEAGTIKTNGKMAAFTSPGDTPTGGEDYAHGSMIVVYDYEENVAAIEQLIAQIDTRPAQVLVEATILQTSLNEANALGVDFSIIADANFSEFVGHGGPLQIVNGLIGGRATPSGGGVLPSDGGASGVASGVGGTSGPGGLKVGIVSNDVAVFLRVLDEVTDTTILSNPKILALNRQSSRVLVGRKVGYLSTTSTDTATTQTVQFLDTGTQLYFRPTVSNDGMIRMELKPQVSEAVIREQQDATGAAVTIPDEITNELTTNVMVRDGQTVVLGGLFRESTISGRKQVPFLGDIPIIGYAFRGQDDEVQRNEIIFMVTPRKVDDAVMASHGSRAKDHENRLRAGAREGTLFFSRDKLTSLLNVKAEEHADKGNTKKALWYIDRSLSMNSNQSEAIGLREKLADEKMNWPERSVLERIIDGEKPTVINKAAAPTSDQITLLATLTNVETEVVNNDANDTLATASPVTPATPAWTADQIAANFYEAGPTSTSYGNVGLFNQFVSLQRNAFLQSLRDDRFTTVPETQPEVEPSIDLNR